MAMLCQHDPTIETAKGCRQCRLVLSHAGYRLKWLGADAGPPPHPELAAPPPREEPKRARCIHLGSRTEFRTGCDGWMCAHKCDLGYPVAIPGGVCQHCTGHDDGKTDTPTGTSAGTRRHLLYYVLPVRDGGIWQLNLDQLKARMGLFNGTRSIAVAVGDCPMPVDSMDAVSEYLADYDCEVFGVPHNPGLREVTAWEPLWNRVTQYADHGDATFFAHAKGVTKPRNPGVTVHDWASVMYESCLDYWPVVQRLLQQHPIAGTFKKLGHGFTGSSSNWHYSGTFYWVRNRDFFARDWRGIDRVWWGTESYPGIRYTADESGAIVKTGQIHELDLYSMKTWQEWLWSEYRQWLARNAGNRSGIGCLKT